MAKLSTIAFYIGVATQVFPDMSHAEQRFAGKPIDEAYRDQFHWCDTTNEFEGRTFPIRNAQGKTVWYGCKSEP